MVSIKMINIKKSYKCSHNHKGIVIEQPMGLVTKGVMCSLYNSSFGLVYTSHVVSSLNLLWSSASNGGP